MSDTTPTQRPRSSVARVAEPAVIDSAALDALRASERRYRRFFEDDLTGDFVATVDGRLVACNAAFAEVFGFDSPAQALQAKAASFYPDPAEREVLLERLRREKVIRRLELELRKRNGEPVYVVENLVGTFDAAGELVEIRGYLFDITEHRRLTEERTQLLVRERAARAVAEAAERRASFLAEVSGMLDASLDYRETLNSLARLVVPTLADYCLIDETTADGGSRRVAVAHVDPDSEQQLRGSEDNPPDADPDRHPVIRVLRTAETVMVPEVTDSVIATIGHDAEHRESLRRIGIRSFIIVPLIARGRTLGAVTLAASVSGRRYTALDKELAEAVARRAALAVDNARLYSRAQEAARAREEVLAFVSHDLRNPLATILLNASALAETIPAERLLAAEREQLEWIARSSEQMNRLIQDLLDVARLEAGRFSVRLTAQAADVLLNEAIQLLTPLAVEKGVRLELSTVSDAPVSADRDKILRVLGNLIGNAIKFTPAEGAVRLSASVSAGEVLFGVEDTGVGIALEDQPHIFDRYWQGRHGRKGSGLGLAIARGIVEAHGGRIWFESTPEHGSRFHFTLLRRPEASDSAPQSEAASA